MGSQRVGHDSATFTFIWHFSGHDIFAYIIMSSNSSVTLEECYATWTTWKFSSLAEFCHFLFLLSRYLPRSDLPLPTILYETIQDNSFLVILEDPIFTSLLAFIGLPPWLNDLKKKIHLQCRGCRRHGFDCWVQKIPCRRARKSTGVFLLGKSCGQRSLLGYSP